MPPHALTPLPLSFARWLQANLVDTCLWAWISLGGLLLVGLTGLPPGLPALLLAAQLLPALLGTLCDARWQTPGRRSAGLVLVAPPGVTPLLVRNLAKSGMLLGTTVLLLGGGGLLYQRLLSPLWTWVALFLPAGAALGGAWLLLHHRALRQGGRTPLDRLTGTHLEVVGRSRRGLAEAALALLLLTSLALLGLALPNSGGPCSRCKNSTVIANMHSLQTMVETYALDWDGQYPASLAALATDARQDLNAYWVEIHNPFPLRQRLGPWEFNLGDGGRERALTEGRPQAGAVDYYPLPDAQGRITAYRIYGYDRTGKWLQDGEQVLVLSNS
ncbi:MAG: hypothetical protein ACO1RX_12560 [Candidatus Sericytochromatia bacterium]